MAAPAERTDSDTPVGPTGIEKFGYTQELKRSLSTADLVIYGLIFMVPMAPFAVFGTVFSLSGGMVHVRRFSQMSRAVTSAPPSWRSSRRAVPGQTR
ncbi:MAG: putative amino acid transporter, partial [Mycobacterium sp.]|nr:putative amino acid transporter [Mycobacterium sp.]